jgi:uncharacterized membrane protein
LEGTERVAAWRPLVSARSITASRAVWAATAVSAIGWAAVAVFRESEFLQARYNLGNFTQAVWATAHGHFLQVTEVGGAQVSRLGIHVDPIIALFAPLWWLWPSPKLLLVAQAFALASGALPLFWLARKHLPRERDAALLAGTYLLGPTIAWNATKSFTAVAFAVPLLLFAIWYLDEDRMLPLLLAAGAATLCQEQVGLVVGCLGLWYAWRRGRVKAGLAIAALGFAVSAVDVLVVLRHFSGGSPFAARYGGSPSELVRDLFTHPISFLHRLHGYDLYGIVLAAPVLGLCFGSTILLAAAPQLALLLVTRRSQDWSWVGGNVLLLVPFIYTATLFVLARSARKAKPREPSLVPGQVLAASLFLAAFLGPFSVAGPLSVFGRNSLLSEVHALHAQQQAVSLVPATAAVSATNHLALSLATRRHLYVFPVVKGADWVVVDSRDVWLPPMSFIRHRARIDVGINDLSAQPKLMRRELRLLTQSPSWQLRYRRDGIYVFRRT